MKRLKLKIKKWYWNHILLSYDYVFTAIDSIESIDLEYEEENIFVSVQLESNDKDIIYFERNGGYEVLPLSLDSLDLIFRFIKFSKV